MAISCCHDMKEQEPRYYLQVSKPGRTQQILGSRLEQPTGANFIERIKYQCQLVQHHESRARARVLLQLLQYWQWQVQHPFIQITDRLYQEKVEVQVASPCRHGSSSISLYNGSAERDYSNVSPSANEHILEYIKATSPAVILPLNQGHSWYNIPPQYWVTTTHSRNQERFNIPRCRPTCRPYLLACSPSKHKSPTNIRTQC